MESIHHMSVDIEGMLRYHKRKKITYMTDDNGKPVSDAEARKHLLGLKAKGHKLMPCSSECEGFDPFEHGCPGHEVKPATP